MNQGPEVRGPVSTGRACSGISVASPLRSVGSTAHNLPDYYPQWTSDSAQMIPPYSWYGGVEYLHWWMNGVPTPPLVTTGSAASAGPLGSPGTQILIDSNSFKGIGADAPPLHAG